MTTSALPRARLLAGLLLVAGLGIGFFFWPRQESSEEKIRHLIVQMSRAAEKKDLSFIMEQVSPNFASPEGWNKQDLKVFLAGQLFRGNWVRVFPTDIRVSVRDSSQANFSGKFILGRSEAADIRELAKKSEIQAYSIEGRLQSERDGRWRITYAEHHSVDPSQLL